jgi:hypothetical protein
VASQVVLSSTELVKSDALVSCDNGCEFHENIIAVNDKNNMSRSRDKIGQYQKNLAVLSLVVSVE